MDNIEEKAREFHKSGKNCAISVYNSFIDKYNLDGVIPEPRSDAGKCGAVIAAEKILRELGKEDKIKEFDKRFIDEFKYIKCVDLMTHERRCYDYVGISAKMVEEYLDS